LNDEDFDLNERVIYFEAGQISLSDLAKEYKMELNINFAPEDLLYFFKSACELVLFLYSENYYHSDIKDDNITLVETD
jgi:serine/threonine protein kinase